MYKSILLALAFAFAGTAAHADDAGSTKSAHRGALDLFPSSFRMIKPADPVTFTTGAIRPSDRLATVPFDFIQPIRTTEPIHSYLYMAVKGPDVMPAGMNGFMFKMFGDHEVMCLFSKGDDVHSSCFARMYMRQRPMGKSVSVEAYSPLPTGLAPTQSSGGGIAYSWPTFTEDGVTLTHPPLTVAFEKWDRGGARLIWSFGSQEVYQKWVLPEKDGDDVRLTVPGGRLKLTPDPVDPKAAVAEFEPAPATP